MYFCYCWNWQANSHVYGENRASRREQRTKLSNLYGLIFKWTIKLQLIRQCGWSEVRQMDQWNKTESSNRFNWFLKNVPKQSSEERKSESVSPLVMSNFLQAQGLQPARLLCPYTSPGMEWVAIPFSRGLSLPRDQTQLPCIACRFFPIWATSAIIIRYL